MEPSEKNKSLKFRLPSVPTKGLESTNSRAEEKPCLRNCDSVIKYSRKQKNVEKATGPGNNGPPGSETRSANQIDDKPPSKEFTGVDVSAFVETKDKDQEGCLAPVSMSKPHAESKASVRQDPTFHSQEKLLSDKIVQLLCEKTSRKVRRKQMKMSSHKLLSQKDLHDTVKARVTELRHVTSMLNQELRRRSTMCMQLSEENELLMDELKIMCDPSVIEALEAKNPNNNSRTN